MTLALLCSTRLSTITSAISSMVLFFLAWMAGMAGTLGHTLHNVTLQRIGEVSQLLLPTDGLWQAAQYYLEPPTVLALLRSLGAQGLNPFVSLAPQPFAFYVWAALWLLAMVLLAVWSMQRREL